MKIIPTPGALTDNSGSIATQDVAQTVAAQNVSRKYLLFQNISDTAMWINFTTTAVADQPSIKVAAGSMLEWKDSFCPSGLLSVICGTSGKKFTCKQA